MSSLETDRLLPDKILNDDLYAGAAKVLSDLGISGLMTLEAIEFQIRELDAALASCQQLQASYAQRKPDLPSELHICLQRSATSIEQLAVLVELIERAPQALWTLRDECFNCYEMDFRLAALQQQLAILKPLSKQLAPFVNINTLGSANSLQSIQHCLDNAGMFRWFSAKWRKAKQGALSFANNEQLKLDDIQMLFPAMIKYVITQEQFDELFVQAPILSTYHQGLNTDVARLLTVREWYKDVTFAIAEHFSSESGLLQGLSVIDKQCADKLVDDYHANLATDIYNLDKQINKLRLSFPEYQALRQADVDYVTAVAELNTIVVKALDVLKGSGVGSHVHLSELLKNKL